MVPFVSVLYGKVLMMATGSFPVEECHTVCKLSY